MCKNLFDPCQTIAKHTSLSVSHAHDRERLPQELPNGCAKTPVLASETRHGQCEPIFYRASAWIKRERGDGWVGHRNTQRLTSKPLFFVHPKTDKTHPVDCLVLPQSVPHNQPIHNTMAGPTNVWCMCLRIPWEAANDSHSPWPKAVS